MTPSQSRAMGLHLHDPSSTMGGDLIHKLIKVMQSTQVPEPLTYYKNHYEGLHHDEQVACSRISFISNDRPGKWPSKQQIRLVMTDNQAHPEAIQ
jgi:hypothetical protein